MPASLLIAAMLATASASAAELIPFERFTLPNGLTVIVHEDRKAPIVAVRIAYHVGAKDEPAGKTGFAHLFEHLMFRGSENFKGDFHQTLADAGAADTNGITTQDTTQYFETVPTPALELVLWLESDRMGHFVDSITQDKLDTERGVVQNEKRGREGGPAGTAVGLRVMEGLFPEGHPYRRPVSGSMADLDAASLEDVRDWFRRYYGAANALVVLAGDIDAARARELVGRYFGDVPPGEPLHRIQAWVPRLPGEVRESMHARVGQASIGWFWPAPPPSARDHTLLRIASQVLSGSLQDRLHGELVEKRKLATAASAGVESFEAAGVASVSVDVRAGADAGEIERVVRREIDRFLQRGPSARELRKIQDDLEAFQLLGLAAVAVKAEWLASAELFTGDPAFGDTTARWVREATPGQVRRAAREWLGRPGYQLTVHPFGEHQATAATFDRSVMPVVAGDLELDLPPIQEATLTSGMKVVLAERHEVPALSMTMVFPCAGTDADLDGKRGIAGTTYTLMNSGPAGMSKLAYSERIDALHASIGVGAGRRDASSSLSVLKKNLRPALALWERTLRSPAFREDDLRLWRESALQGIANARTNPDVIGGRLLTRALYPEGHPYASRDDEEDLVAAIDVAELREFHAARVRPDTAKLFVVGDTTLPEITRELERIFSDWKGPRTPPQDLPEVAAAPLPAAPRFILVDWPGETQTRIAGGRFVLPAGSDESRMLRAANDVLGAGVTARLGQRLRVEKGWSYGIASGLDGALGQQYWGFSTSVQDDKTAEAVAEIIDVIQAITGPLPATEAELAQFVKGQSRSLAGLLESPDSVLAAMVQSDALGRPYDWVEGAKARLDALKLEDVNRLARQYFTPENLTWVLVGDLEKFEHRLRALEFGTVEVWDQAGNRVR